VLLTGWESALNGAQLQSCTPSLSIVEVRTDPSIDPRQQEHNLPEATGAHNNGNADQQYRYNGCRCRQGHGNQGARGARMYRKAPALADRLGCLWREHSELVLQRVVLEQEVLLQAVAPAAVLVVVHDVVVKVHVRALLVVVVGALGLLVSLRAAPP